MKLPILNSAWQIDLWDWLQNIVDKIARECSVCKGLSVRYGLNWPLLWGFVTFARPYMYLPKKSSPLSMNPKKLRHLVPLQAGIAVVVGYWSSLLHRVLLLGWKSYRMTMLPLDVGVVTVLFINQGSSHMKRWGMTVGKIERPIWVFLPQVRLESLIYIHHKQDSDHP